MLDAYDRKARLAPAGLAAVPALALVGGGLLEPTRAASIIAIAFGAVGVLICGLVREAGLRIQPALWASWGGAPTTRKLRWAGSSDRSQTQRLHERVSPLLLHPLPTEGEEQIDPGSADRRYEEAVAALRERTRDQDQFSLLFRENMEYGFRRNCLGLRPYAVAIAGTTLVIGAIAAVASEGGQRLTFVAAIALASLALVGWLLLVRPRWAELAAERYANQLLASAESLRVQ